MDIYGDKTLEGTTQILKGLTSYWKDRTHSYSMQNLEEMNDWRRQAWRDLILSHAPHKDRLRILDVGTGPGFFAMNLSLAGHDVTAVDATEHMLYHAMENAWDYKAKVNFVLARGEFLPFEDGSFDLIVSRNVLWNLEYPEKALSEWVRVLSPGGRLVYFDANWYLYLYDEELKLKREEKREAFKRRHSDMDVTWGLGPYRVRELEQMALALPLSKERRPDWDTRVLKGLGMQDIKVEEEIGRKVQDPVEFERDDPTFVFMVCAEKPAPMP
ncbi:MAG: class I SAM-dependent methyltransferase [Blautia sp.]|nr:class I SAM-dependent methyltransferase [Blautia sp.]